MSAQHREVREALGLYALQRLEPDEAQLVRSHLDGCPSCRAELAELAPLPGLLAGVEADRLTDTVVPPPGLRDAVLSRVALERARSRRRARSRVPLLAGAAAAVLLLGGVLGWSVRPVPTEPPTTEVAVATVPATGVAASAELIDHTWGMEVVLEAEGFADGRRYTVEVVERDGDVVQAGGFVGVGGRPMTCRLNSSVMLSDAASFRVVDDDQQPVLTGTWG